MSDYLHVPAQVALPANSKRLEASFSYNLSGPTSALNSIAAYLEVFHLLFRLINRASKSIIGGLQDFELDLPLSHCALHRMHMNMLVCIQVTSLFTPTLVTPTLDGAHEPTSTVSNATPASPADSQATVLYSVPASPADSQATLRYSVPASPADSQATLRYSVPASPADSQATLRYSVLASPLRFSFPASPAETLQYPGLPENPDSLCFESKQSSTSERRSRRVRRRIGYA